MTTSENLSRTESNVPDSIELPDGSHNMYLLYRVFHFEMSISAPLLDLGSKSQQILTLAWARSIWDFQLLGAKARAMPADFSDSLGVKPVR
jgi:hypothetical protein